MFESGELFPLTPKLDLIVGEVVNNSPAERSGLKKGDKIIAVNQIEINDFNSFTTILRERKLTLLLKKQIGQLDGMGSILQIP